MEQKELLLKLMSKLSEDKELIELTKEFFGSHSQMLNKKSSGITLEVNITDGKVNNPWLSARLRSAFDKELSVYSGGYCMVIDHDPMRKNLITMYKDISDVLPEPVTFIDFDEQEDDRDIVTILQDYIDLQDPINITVLENTGGVYSRYECVQSDDSVGEFLSDLIERSDFKNGCAIKKDQDGVFFCIRGSNYYDRETDEYLGQNLVKVYFN